MKESDITIINTDITITDAERSFIRLSRHDVFKHVDGEIDPCIIPKIEDLYIISPNLKVPDEIRIPNPIKQPKSCDLVWSTIDGGLVKLSFRTASMISLYHDQYSQSISFNDEKQFVILAMQIDNAVTLGYDILVGPVPEITNE